MGQEKTAKLATFQADEVILREGEACEEMYKILSGSVVVYIRYGEKDEHMVGVYSKSKCFGELTMLTGQPGIYTVVAYDQVLLMRIGKDELEGFIRDNPRNAVEIMRNMASSMALMRKNVDLLLDEVYEKNRPAEQTIMDQKRRIMDYCMAVEWESKGFSMNA